MSADSMLAEARAAVAELRDEAGARHGWTRMALELSREGERVVVCGEVVVARQVDEVGRAIAEVLPGVAVDTGGVVTLRTSDWRALARSPMLLHRGAPGSPVAAAIATELVFGDGPVERLAEHGGATLVRAVDGTVGWIADAPGPATLPPVVVCTGLDVHAFVAAARGWVGTPYRLGGTTAAGIDCSALAQRCVRAAGALVPRHSADQLALGEAEGEGLGEPGDLVMVWAADEAPCHVALSVGGGLIVHASRSRARVVEEPREAIVARATRVRHVPRARIVELARELAGAACLADVVRLGVPRDRVGLTARR